jgi:dihydrofolate reductase
MTKIRSEPTGADKEYIDESLTQAGAVIGGRTTYEAAEHWGGSNPWPVPFFILTHRPEEQPADGGETIREALRAGYIDEFTLTIAPVTLGAGKRLFEGFDAPLKLEPTKVWHSPLATHIAYRVVR